MYMPPAFSEQRLEALHDAIRHYPLATLVTAGPALTANHIPFVIHPDRGSNGLGLLRAHLARGNEQARVDASPADALVVFTGVDHYITPSWYETKRRTGKVVPTWNYVAVHAAGPLRVIDDADWVREQIQSLTAQHEAARSSPWAVSDAPADFIAAQLRGIVGIEIDIAELQGKWKLSQNRSQDDRRGVVEGLRGAAGAGGDEAAGTMAPMIDTD